MHTEACSVSHLREDIYIADAILAYNPHKNMRIKNLGNWGWNVSFNRVSKHTSRDERLAKAEAPSEARLLLASRRERLPGGRRWRGGRERRPRPLQSTKPSEKQRQGGGQEEAPGSSTASRQRPQRRTGGGRKGRWLVSFPWRTLLTQI